MSERTEKIRKKARAAYKAGEYEEVAVLLARLAANRDESEPLNVRVGDHMDLGTAFARIGRHSEAVAEFEAVIKLAPKNVVAHAKLGQELVRVGRPTQAFEVLREAARLSPKDANIQWSLSKVARAVGEDRVADLALAACLAADPEHEEARMTAIAKAPPQEGGFPMAPVADSAFADLLQFVQMRPGTDAPPATVVDQSFRPLATAAVSALSFMAIFLMVRFILIG